MKVSHTTTFPVLTVFPRNVPWADTGGFGSDPLQLSLYVERECGSLAPSPQQKIQAKPEGTRGLNGCARDLKEMQYTTWTLGEGEQGEITLWDRNQPKISCAFFVSRLMVDKSPLGSQ